MATRYRSFFFRSRALRDDQPWMRFDTSSAILIGSDLKRVIAGRMGGRMRAGRGPGRWFRGRWIRTSRGGFRLRLIRTLMDGTETTISDKDTVHANERVLVVRLPDGQTSSSDGEVFT